MLEGIEILNKTEIMAAPTWYAILFVVLIVVGIASIIIAVGSHETKVGLGAAITFIITLCTFLVLIAVNPEEATGRYKYEVTIDENVSFKDLYAQYNVVEQRGDIWVLTDK